MGQVFNTGYVEGDGGVMYVGASLTNGYGMHYRENFVHHSMEVSTRPHPTLTNPL